MTALTTVAMAAAPKVSFSAATLAGFETASQNPPKPPVCTCASRAASGSSTMMPR